MINMLLCFEDGRRVSKTFSLPLTIGRQSSSQLCLTGWRVGRNHAQISRCGKDLVLEDFGTLTGTVVNGERAGAQTVLNDEDEIIIGDCLMVLKCRDYVALAGSSTNTPSGVGAAPASGSYSNVSHETRLEPDVKEIAADYINLPPADTGAVGQANGSVEEPLSGTADYLVHRRRLHQALLSALDLRRRDIAGLSDDALRQEAAAALERLIQQDEALPAEIDRHTLLSEVVNEAIGLGPLEPLLADPTITEIMVNRHDEIYVESRGRLYRHSSGFSSEAAVIGVIDRIVAPLGRRIDESSPMVDARLKDGSRVNAVIPPVALRGASLTIRKFPKRRPTIDELRQLGSFSLDMQRFLQLCVRVRKNVIVSGGTGSGKTTLLNVLSNCIPQGERVVTIEDAAELQLDHAHKVTLEARPPNLEGRGRIEIRDLVRNALRMRPDRIVVGECRGAEAFDMLTAMNTGHEGSLTTLHANSPRDALSRLETMILMAGMDLPLAAVREHIAAGIDLIVQQARLCGGQRLVTAIVQVTGIESGRIQLQPLFQYVDDEHPCFRGCGSIPDRFSVEALRSGDLDVEAFSRSEEVITAQGA
jgi:pilus assembly protein CpaF